MKDFKTIMEDVYTSEYKLKKWVDPVTGKTKERKVRPHRVEFDASKLRGEPAQKDAQGDYGMKEETMNEATVKTNHYSWGTMKTIHHGASFSIPLHPEHHEAIAKLHDNQEHKFKTEDGRHWTAKRMGDDVHFHSANNGPKTTVKHSTMQEEVESVEEQLLEVLSKDAKAGEWISDFVKSDNPKFAGKSKKERIKMALGAYYGKQNEEVESIHEKLTDSQKEAVRSLNHAKGGTPTTSGTKKAIKFVKQNEEVEQIEERNKENATKRKMMDASRGARYKLNNPVPDAEPEHKTAQAHNKAIGRALRSEGVNDRPKSTEVKSTTALAPMGTTTSGATVKDTSGVAHSTMSRARRLARLALGKKTTNEAKEQYKGLEKEDKKGLPTAMIKKSEKAVEGDTVEGWDHPHDAVKEEVQKVDVPAYLRKAKGEKPLELKDLKRKDTISDAENLKKATGIKESKRSYKDFMMLEYEVDKNGKYVHKGTYGSSYAKAEREKDEAGFESEPEKAKRGPKTGSKRGARANYGSSKLHTK